MSSGTAKTNVLMNQEPKRKKRGVSRALFYVGLIVWPFTASAQHGVVQGMPLRNQNPFLQIFGLPPFQSARLVPAGSLEYAVSPDIVSHAESGANPLEDIFIDGESYFLVVSFRRGLMERFAGVLLLGDGEVLPDLQRSALSYGGAAAAWWISDRFGVSAQLQAEGPYYDSEIDELGGASAQLAVGFEYRLPQQGTSLHFSITEDIAARRQRRISGCTFQYSEQVGNSERKRMRRSQPSSSVSSTDTRCPARQEYDSFPVCGLFHLQAV